MRFLFEIQTQTVIWKWIRFNTQTVSEFFGFLLVNAPAFAVLSRHNGHILQSVSARAPVDECQ